LTAETQTGFMNIWLLQWCEEDVTGLGQGFELIETGYEVHVTPTGMEQKFTCFHFMRVNGD